MKKRCLIVDDSDVIRKVARYFIERFDYEVIEAEDAQEAIEICNKNMPDVIVLDWILPGMGTLELLTALRLHGGKKRPFVLYCTTEYDPADLSRAFSAGADDYLMKPFDRESLTAKFTAAGLTG